MTGRLHGLCASAAAAGAAEVQGGPPQQSHSLAAKLGGKPRHAMTLWRRLTTRACHPHPGSPSFSRAVSARNSSTPMASERIAGRSAGGASVPRRRRGTGRVKLRRTPGTLVWRKRSTSSPSCTMPSTGWSVARPSRAWKDVARVSARENRTPSHDTARRMAPQGRVSSSFGAPDMAKRPTTVSGSTGFTLNTPRYTLFAAAS
mmetsp:Transcript_27496/g.91917  ORF Transcript_27496/g.91917 Transcript_27496/m.91917 type:complete len:203 (-) Transcript_27496:990-1598(-)